MIFKKHNRDAFVAIFLVMQQCFLGGQTFAQAVSAESIFDNYRKHHLQEKLFVHTDKDHYLTGEIAWMKIYATDASFHLPSMFSKVAYVELLDANNEAIVTEKIGVENGFGEGSFVLPASLSSGKFKLRAYTNWMKNDSADFFFEKAITVINAQRSSELPPPTVVKTSVHFFAEGGNLVNGIESTVAYTVKDAYGNGIACKGTITDDGNNVVTNFTTQKFGIGTLKFTPSESRVYKANFTLSDNTTISETLPVALDKGIVLHAERSNGKTICTIKSSGLTSGISAQVFLFAHCRQSIKKSFVVGLQNGTATVEIKDEEFGEGVNHITVFNNDGQPVCERLVFVYPKYPVKLHMLPSKSSTGIRSKQVFTTSSEALTNTNLSLSVYKVDSLQNIQESFIDDYLLLSSDLTGNIESPAYYFSNISSEVISNMDNLMLTKGWRRFKLKDVLARQQITVKYPPEMAGHFVTGRIVDNTTNLPAAGKLAYLSVPGVYPFFQSAISDSAGDIRFVVKDVYGAPGIIVQTDAEDSLYHPEINKPFATSFSDRVLPPYKFPLQQQQTMLAQNIAMQVRKAYNLTELDKYYNPIKDTTPFFGKASESYLFDNYTRFTTMEEIFREYVPYIAVRKRDGNFMLPMYNDAIGNGTFDIDPMILVDGVPLFSVNKVMAIDPLKYKRMDLVTRKYLFGQASFNGIINISSYSGDIEGVKLDPRVIVIDYESLQLQREFYAPVYENDEQRSSHLPDFRYQLYWNPNITLGANETKKISFYTSDVKGKFVAILQGITTDGKPCKVTTSFEVE